MLETTEAARPAAPAAPAAAAALRLLLPPPPSAAPVSPTDRPQQRWLRPPSARRRPRSTSFGSSSSSTSGVVVDPGHQEDGFRTAYDAYHEADVTLGPHVHGLLPRRAGGNPSGGGPSSSSSTGDGGHRSGGGALYLPGCRMLPLQPVCLDYQDFAPVLSGFDDAGNLGCCETFADLVCRANDWLRQNPQMAVKTCETITWSTSRVTEVGDTENMVQQCDPQRGHQLCDEDIYFFSGLRVWVIPEKLSSSAPSGSSAVGWNGHHRIGYRDYNTATRNSLSHFFARVNDDLTKRPLQGKVNAVETVLVPEFLSGDTGCLFWKKTPNQPSRSVAFLRIFYHPECDHPPETIGVKIILPENVGCGYEPFSALFARAVAWTKKESNWTRVTNFKSYNIPCSGSSLDKDANGCVHLSSSSSDSVASPLQTTSSLPLQQYFQVFRIFYVRRSPRFSSPASGHDDPKTAVQDEEDEEEGERGTGLRRPRGGGDAASGGDRRRPAACAVRCAVFSPVQTSVGLGVRTTFERMKPTALKISAWMLQNAIDVHSVETYISPLLPFTEIQSLPEMTSWSLHGTKASTKCLSNDRRSLMHIRVYFERRTDPTIVDHPDPQESEDAEESEHNRQRSRRLRDRRSLPAKASTQPQPPPPQEPCVIIPVTQNALPAAVETALIEQQRKQWEKQRRWRNRKLRIAMSCILMFAISIPAGVLFYFNAVQTPD